MGVMSSTETRTSDDGLAAFEAARPRLFGVAYRMLGTRVEAEDVLQDAWLRWQQADRGDIREPIAFLTTVVTRLAINVLGSARVQREAYVGPWLPEPVSTADDPMLGAERGEALDAAVLLLLERLSAAERAAYVLREAFDYPFRRIAEVLEISEANARQLAKRARDHIIERRTSPVDVARRSELLEAFVAAARLGDIERLESLLVTDAIALSDGGGLVTAARVPVIGRDRVIQFLLGILRTSGKGLPVRALELNGSTAMLATRDDEPVSLLTLDIGADGIHQLLFTVSPLKLASIRGLKR
jgi:RNA polymerase sigma-70 factor (ECF subfamily)